MKAFLVSLVVATGVLVAGNYSPFYAPEPNGAVVGRFVVSALADGTAIRTDSATGATWQLSETVDKVKGLGPVRRKAWVPVAVSGYQMKDGKLINPEGIEVEP